MKDRLRRLHSDEDGQVMWFFAMTALALVVLAALVMNTGRQIARKIEMQNAADSAAVSSAVWIARGMNVISMDNVGMTESLGLIANLRAMHIAWQVNEVILSAEAVVAEALIDGIFTAPAGIVLMALVYAGWLPTCTAQLADVQGCALFEGPFFPPTGLDTSAPGQGVFDGSWDDGGLAHPTDGLLWEFMSLLQDVNTGMQYASPTLAFAEAVNVGRGNISPGEDSRIAVMLPNFGNGELTTEADNPGDAQQITGGYGLPVEIADFHELCDPTQNGTLSASTAVKTYGYVPLQYQNFFGDGPQSAYPGMNASYTGPNRGPFPQYESDFHSFWMPSIVTGIPWIYDALAAGSMSLFCGGNPPPIPPVTTRIAPLNKAQGTPGATGFTWIHWTVDTLAGRPPTACDSTCFTPATPPGGVSQTLQGLAGNCAPTDTACLQQATQGAGQALQGIQNAQAAPPTFNNPAVDAKSFQQLAALTQPDGTLPFSLNSPPCSAPQVGLGFCRLSGTDVFEQITVQASSACPKPQPQPGQAAPPPAPPCQIYQDERYVFQYATVTQSIAALSGGQSVLQKAGGLMQGGSDDYPQPMHFALSPGTNLADHPEQLPPPCSAAQPPCWPPATGAIQRLQYLAVAYRSAVANPWMQTLQVTAGNDSGPVFDNPNWAGLLTYAQSQVYNPTSWDLYTQNWHAKLVPASLLERGVGSFGSAGINSVFTLVAPIGGALNAH